MVFWAIVRKESWRPYALCQKSYWAAFTAPFGDVFLREADVGEQFPQFPRFVDLSNLYIQPALDLVWNGESSAADALGGIKDKVNAELAK